MKTIKKFDADLHGHKFKQSLILALFFLSITSYGQSTYETITRSEVTPVISNFQDRLNEYLSNPREVEIEPKKPGDKIFIPPNPLPKEKNIQLFNGKPSITDSENFQTLSLPSLAPSVGFDAIIDNIATIPPDVAGAVGPTHVMTTLNNGIQYQDRAGGNATFIDDNDFFSTIRETTSVYDPKILFDPHTQRFYFFDLDGANSATSNLLLAVSHTSDPTGSWYLYKFKTNIGETTIWFDFPTIGYNKDWIVASGNMFQVDGSFEKAKLFVIKKSDVLSGLATSVNEIAFANSSSGFTVAPAVVADNTTNYIPLMSNWNNGLGAYKLFKITGVPPSAPSLSDVGFPILGAANGWLGGTYYYNQAPQMDMTSRTNGVDDGDHRMCNLVLKNGNLWAVHTAFFSSSGGYGPTDTYRGAVQWLNVNPNTAAINEWGRIIDNGTTNMGSYSVPTNSFAFPSLAINDNEDVLINFAHFSPTTYPSSSYALKLGGSSTFSSNYTYKAGVEHYYKRYGGSRNRWGDYFTALVDPVNGIDFWSLGEYSTTNNGTHDRWATYWAKLSMSMANEITLTSISGTLCAEKDYNLNFTAAGTYTAGNMFKAELSNNAGTFGAPVQVGSLAGTTSGIVITNVPASVLGGNGYKLRIVSTNPVITSTNSLNVTVIPKDLAVGSGTVAPFEAVEDITAQDVEITGNKQYKAGKSITLIATPTTNVSTGANAVFEAKIVGCPY